MMTDLYGFIRASKNTLQIYTELYGLLKSDRFMQIYLHKHLELYMQRQTYVHARSTIAVQNVAAAQFLS